MGVLVRVGSVHPAPQSDPSGTFDAPVRSGSAPGADPFAGTGEDECRVAGGATRLGGLGRSAASTVGTAAGRGSVVTSGEELGTAPTGMGRTAEGSGAGDSGTVGAAAEETITGAERLTGGAETAGT